MKKTVAIIVAVLIYGVAALALFASPVGAASWSVTVTWTRSVGPNLASEQVLYNGATQCTVDAASPTTCNFTIPDLSGAVKVRSFNAQGAYIDTAETILQICPAPATGVSVNVTFVP
jgi:hypothetical protein